MTTPSIFHRIHSSKTISSYLLLLAGMILFTFANGNWIIPAFAWIAPVLLIRAARDFDGWKGLLAFYLLLAISNMLRFKGVIPVPGVFFYLMMIMTSAVAFLPFFLDRWFSRRLNGLLLTLVYPMITVANEFLTLVTSDFSATWGSLAYTQDNIALLQIVSLTGVWGLTFLISWTASMLNYLWESRTDSALVKRATILLAGALSSIIVFGEIHKQIMPSNVDTVRIATVVHDEAIADSARFWNDGNKLMAFHKRTELIQSKVLDMASKAAAQGAKMVFLHEGSLLVSAEDERALIEKSKALAIHKSIYLGLSLYSMPMDFPNTYGENKIIWIDPKGAVVLSYNKAYAAPNDLVLPGKKEINAFDTPYGRVASVICFDMDFPSFIHQASQKDVDIMLVPANDWSEIDRIHPKMASLRAIENGFSMVRATGGGLSLAVDFKGNVLNQSNFVASKENIMLVDVPVKGTDTLYGYIGDAFGWVCLAGLPLLFLFAFWPSKRHAQFGNKGTNSNNAALASI